MHIGVRHDTAAWTAHRSLISHEAARGLATERLASGLRINRAADDAAGLAISEGLRSIAGGTRMAIRNVQDGIAMVRTAEGALGSAQTIAQRMRELAVQRGNADVLGEPAVGAIDTELAALRSEIGRVLEAATWGSRALLDGSSFTLQVGAAAGDTIEVRTPDLAAVRTFVAGAGASSSVSGPAGTPGAPQTPAEPAEPVTNPPLTATETAATSTAGATVRISDLDLRDATSFDRLNGTISYRGASLDLSTVDFDAGADAPARLATLQQALDDALGAGAVTVSADGADALFTGRDVVTAKGNGGGNGKGNGGSKGNGNGPGLTAQDVQVSFTPTDAPTPSKAASGQEPTSPAAVTPAPAPEDVALPQDPLIDSLDAVLEQLSSARAYYGAVDNRLAHTAGRLAAGLGETVAAESRIRDADHALEASRLLRAQIGSEVAVAMLAQAVRTPAQLVSLLR